MNKLTVSILVVIIIVAIAGGAYYYYSNTKAGTVTATTSVSALSTTTTTASLTGTGTSTTTQTTASELTSVEIEAIKYMAEEEKLAYDVYTKLAQMYPNVPVFANIAKSEQTHVNAVLSLAKKYHVNITLGKPGVFNNTHIQELYNKLISMGSKGLEDALKVGALVEETGIKDLQDWIAKVQHSDIKQVFECLMMGSRNHLRAFTSTLEKMFGVEYTPQVISIEEYKQIINSPMETGGTECSALRIDVGANVTVTTTHGKK